MSSWLLFFCKKSVRCSGKRHNQDTQDGFPSANPGACVLHITIMQSSTSRKSISHLSKVNTRENMGLVLRVWAKNIDAAVVFLFCRWRQEWIKNRSGRPPLSWSPALAFYSKNSVHSTVLLLSGWERWPCFCTTQGGWIVHEVIDVQRDRTRTYEFLEAAEHSSKSYEETPPSS